MDLSSSAGSLMKNIGHVKYPKLFAYYVLKQLKTLIKTHLFEVGF